MNELDLNAMEQGTGGVQRVINTGSEGLNAAIRRAPTTGERNQIASLPNGTIVDTIDEAHPVFDSVSNRNFVMISFTNKKGQTQTGWVAASIVGLRRR